MWLGLALVVVPMNFIACAWNDLRDADVDAHCKRKTTQDNLLVNAFGMAYDHQQMAWVPRTIVLSTLAVGALMMWAGASLLGTVVLVTSFLFANASYNEKPFQLSRRGPLELLIVIYVYLHALFLPSMVSDLPGPSLVLVIIAALYVAALQLAGEITDMKTDKIQGKITTAVLLGQKGAIWTCRVVLVVLAYLCFREDMLGLLAVSGVGIGWLFVPMKRARSQASETGTATACRTSPSVRRTTRWSRPGRALSTSST